VWKGSSPERGVAVKGKKKKFSLLVRKRRWLGGKKNLDSIMKKKTKTSEKSFRKKRRHRPRPRAKRDLGKTPHF